MYGTRQHRIPAFLSLSRTDIFVSLGGCETRRVFLLSAFRSITVNDIVGFTSGVITRLRWRVASDTFRHSKRLILLVNASPNERDGISERQFDSLGRYLAGNDTFGIENKTFHHSSLEDPLKMVLIMSFYRNRDRSIIADLTHRSWEEDLVLPRNGTTNNATGSSRVPFMNLFIAWVVAERLGTEGNPRRRCGLLSRVASWKTNEMHGLPDMLVFIGPLSWASPTRIHPDRITRT